jgi:hypothetical protein
VDALKSVHGVNFRQEVRPDSESPFRGDNPLWIGRPDVCRPAVRRASQNAGLLDHAREFRNRLVVDRRQLRPCRIVGMLRPVTIVRKWVSIGASKRDQPAQAIVSARCDNHSGLLGFPRGIPGPFLCRTHCNIKGRAALPLLSAKSIASLAPSQNTLETRSQLDPSVRLANTGPQPTWPSLCAPRSPEAC